MVSKRKTQAPKASLTIDIRGQSLECASPTAEQWDRYLDKLYKGQDRVARRELIMGCSRSHKPADVVALIDRHPAMVEPLASALGDLAGEDLEVEVDWEEGVARCEGLTFAAADNDAWERHQERVRKDGPGPAVRAIAQELADDKPAAAALLAQKPGLVFRLQLALSELAGSNFKIEVKKE